MRKRGFTLIELLVVMFIIAILASLVIVNVSESRKNTRDTQRVANLRSIQTALEQFNQKNGVYPYGTSDSTGNIVAKYPDSTTTCTFCNSCADSTTNRDCANRHGWAGNGSDYGGYGNTGTASDWVPGLVPDFLSILPLDPKEEPTATASHSYLYKSDGKDYKIITQPETCVSSGGVLDCTLSGNPTSLREIAVSTDPKFVGFWSPGAASW